MKEHIRQLKLAAAGNGAESDVNACFPGCTVSAVVSARMRAMYKGLKAKMVFKGQHRDQALRLQEVVTPAYAAANAAEEQRKFEARMAERRAEQAADPIDQPLELVVACDTPCEDPEAKPGILSALGRLLGML